MSGSSLVTSSSFIWSLSPFRKTPWNTLSFQIEAAARILNSTAYSIMLWEPWQRVSRCLMAFLSWTGGVKDLPHFCDKARERGKQTYGFPQSAVPQSRALSLRSPVILDLSEWYIHGCCSNTREHWRRKTQHFFKYRK